MKKRFSQIEIDKLFEAGSQKINDLKRIYAVFRDKGLMYNITYFLPLPFKVPAKTPCTFSIDSEGNTFSLHLYSRQDRHILHAPISHSVLLSKETMAAACLSVFSKEKLDVEDQETQIVYLDKCLHLLNILIMTMQDFQKEYIIHLISRGQIAPYIGVMGFHGKNWKLYGASVMFNFSYPGVKIYKSKQINWVKLTKKLGKMLNPISYSINSLIWLSSAKRHLITGNLPEAVICAETAFEVCCNEILLRMLLEEDRTSKEIKLIFSKGLISRLKSQYGCRIGGIWHPKNKNSHLYNWNSTLYALRNVVVHEGIHQNLKFESVKKSLNETVSAVNSIFKLCASSKYKWLKYPTLWKKIKA